MQIYSIFFAFIFQRFNKNKKLFMIESSEKIENDFLIEMKKIKMAKHAGRDERYSDDIIDNELSNKITKNMIKLELLSDLQDYNISIFDKLLLLENNKDFFITSNLLPNITAGGLLDNFYTLEDLNPHSG
jgi:hypothetical protein